MTNKRFLFLLGIFSMYAPQLQPYIQGLVRVYEPQPAELTEHIAAAGVGGVGAAEVGVGIGAVVVGAAEVGRTGGLAQQIRGRGRSLAPKPAIKTSSSVTRARARSVTFADKANVREFNPDFLAAFNSKLLHLNTLRISMINEIREALANPKNPWHRLSCLMPEVWRNPRIIIVPLTADDINRIGLSIDDLIEMFAYISKLDKEKRRSFILLTIRKRGSESGSLMDQGISMLAGLGQLGAAVFSERITANITDLDMNKHSGSLARFLERTYNSTHQTASGAGSAGGSARGEDADVASGAGGSAMDEGTDAVRRGEGAGDSAGGSAMDEGTDAVRRGEGAGDSARGAGAGGSARGAGAGSARDEDADALRAAAIQAAEEDDAEVL